MNEQVRSFGLLLMMMAASGALILMTPTRALASCSTNKSIIVQDPEQTQALYGVQAQLWRPTSTTLDSACDGSEKFVYTEMDQTGYLNFSQLGWVAYWCSGAGGSVCVDVNLFQERLGVTRCNHDYTGPDANAFSTYKIAETTLNTNDKYWKFLVDYGHGGGLELLGHCLSDSNAGYVRGDTTEAFGVAHMDTQEQVLRKRTSAPSDTTWVAWGSNQCIQNETTGWNYHYTSDTSYEVISGNGAC